MKVLLLFLLSFPILSFAEVKCRDPSGGGDDSTEGAAVSANCNSAVTASKGDGVDRDVNVGQIVASLENADTSSSGGSDSLRGRGSGGGSSSGGGGGIQ